MPTKRYKPEYVVNLLRKMAGIPEHPRSDNGPEFVAKEVRKWLARLGTGTL